MFGDSFQKVLLDTVHINFSPSSPPKTNIATDISVIYSFTIIDSFLIVSKVSNC